MMQNIKQILQSFLSALLFRDSTRQPGLQYRINLLRVIITMNITASLIWVFYIIFSTMSNKPTALLMILSITGFNIGILYLVQHNQVTIAGRLVIGYTWILVAYAAYTSGGLYASAIMILMAVLVIGSIVLDKIATVILYAVTIIFFFLLLFIELSGNLPDAPFKDLPFRILILCLIATILFLIIRYHRYALQKSEQAVAELQIRSERHHIVNEMTQNLAHDLRTPMSSVKATAYLIRRRHEKGLPIDETIDRLEQETDRLSLLIEDLFRLSLLDTRETNYALNKIDLAQVIIRCVNDMKNYANHQGIDIAMPLTPEQTYYVEGEENLLKRAFDNLIENAIHYGHSGGYVRVVLSLTENEVITKVEDNGIGIAPEYHPYVFDRFFRVDPSRPSHHKRGTGIGLNAVSEIVHIHRGEIELDSVPGEGSVFTVRLPAAN